MLGTAGDCRTAASAAAPLASCRFLCAGDSRCSLPGPGAHTLGCAAGLFLGRVSEPQTAPLRTVGKL